MLLPRAATKNGVTAVVDTSNHQTRTGDQHPSRECSEGATDSRPGSIRLAARTGVGLGEREQITLHALAAGRQREGGSVPGQQHPESCREHAAGMVANTQQQVRQESPAVTRVASGASRASASVG